MKLRIQILALGIVFLLVNPAPAVSTPERPKILILPVFIEDRALESFQWGIWSLIKGKIESRGVDVVEKGDLLKLNLKDDVLSERSAVLKIAKELSASYALRVLLKKEKNALSLDMFLYSIKEENEQTLHTSIRHQDQLIHQAAALAIQVAEAISFWEGTGSEREKPSLMTSRTEERKTPSAFEKPLIHEEQEKPGKTGGFEKHYPIKSTGVVLAKDVPYIIRSITTCDIDRDGSDEIIALTKSEIIFYKLTSDELKETNRYSKKGMELVSISSGDFDQNGKCELYVSAMKDGKPSSFIIEGDGANIEELKNGLHYHISSISQGREKRLFVQEMDSSGYGKIFPAKWKENNIELENSQIYKNLQISVFSMALSDVDDDGNDEVIFQDERGSIIIATDKTVKLEKQSFSLNFNSFEYTPEWAGKEKAGSCCFLKIPPRVIAADIDGDGRVEMLTIRNYYADMKEKSSGISRGYVSQISISGKGRTITELWRGVERTGYITDFSIGEFTGSKTKGKAICYSVVISAGGMITKPASSIVIEFMETK